MNPIVSIDIGTTSIVALALDVDSDQVLVVRSDANAATLNGLPAGHHEQDAAMILEIVKSLLSHTVADLRQGCSGQPSIRAIAVTGQMHGLLLVDTNNQPRSQLITWRDQRAAGLNEVLELSRDRDTVGRCGCRLHPGYGFASLHKLIRENAWVAPALVSGDARVCGVTDYVVASLAGCLVTDATMAASWGGLDIRTQEWDPCALDALGIPDSALPPIRDSVEPIASISPAIAAELGLDAGALVCVGIGDHQAGILGCGPIGTGSCVVNLGTGGQVSLLADEPGTENTRLEIRPFVKDDYVITGTSLCGGWSYQYLADFFRSLIRACTGGEISRDTIYEMMKGMGERAPENANGLVVNPFFLGSRHSGEDMGSVNAIDSKNLTPENLVRAMANGMVDELFGYYRLMQSPAKRVYVTGSAVNRNPLLVRAIKDRWGIMPSMAAHDEAAAYGAARLASARLGLLDGSLLFA